MFTGYYPQESLYKPYKYHGYTVRGTPNCPLNKGKFFKTSTGWEVGDFFNYAYIWYVYIPMNKIMYIPIGSMYGMFTYIYQKKHPTVGKYIIHGLYGIDLYIYKNCCQKDYDVTHLMSFSTLGWPSTGNLVTLHASCSILGNISQELIGMVGKWVTTLPRGLIQAVWYEMNELLKFLTTNHNIFHNEHCQYRVTILHHFSMHQPVTSWILGLESSLQNNK